MSTLKTSDLEDMTGLSQRYWQRRIAAGEVPGAEELVCGTGRRFLIDSDAFKAWWAKQRRPVTCQKISVSAGGSGGIAWHDLRRTCGSRLLQDRGLTMDEVAKWLGHSSVRVTERHYAFLRVEHLHRALARNVVKLKRG